jgi:hypothetical protein
LDTQKYPETNEVAAGIVAVLWANTMNCMMQNMMNKGFDHDEEWWYVMMIWFIPKILNQFRGWWIHNEIGFDNKIQIVWGNRGWGLRNVWKIRAIDKLHMRKNCNWFERRSRKWICFDACQFLISLKSDWWKWNARWKNERSELA